MGDEFYRKESIEGARSRYGRPAAQLGLSSWLLAGFLLTVFAVVIAFISTAKYARKETVLGIVMPAQGVQRVAALRGGMVTKSFVKSGDRIQEAAPLFLMSYDTYLEGGAPLSQELNAVSDLQLDSVNAQNHYKKQQIRQDISEAQTRKAGLEDELVTLNQQRKLQMARVALLQKNYDAALSLIDKKFVSEIQLRQREDALLQAQQSLQQFDQSIARTAAEIRQLDVQVEGQKAAYAMAGAELDLSHAQFAEKTLTARSSGAGELRSPRNGQVTNIQVREGDVVAANQTLALVIPEKTPSPYVVHLWVPSRAVGFVSSGTQVRIMFDAFPYQTFGVGTGRVSEVSTAPLMPGELPVPIETREQMYRLVVQLDRDSLKAYGRDWSLMPGMRLSADLVLEERSLLDWLLDPIMATRKRGGY